MYEKENRGMKENISEQDALVQQIRAQYLPKEESDFDKLKALDRKVKLPADIFAYLLGSVSALVMGAGMSLIMTDISTKIGMTESMIPGVVIGIAGMLMAAVNYPIYRKILNNRRQKYASQIFALSDKIGNEV